ncbi:hypothetical protein MRB53_009327 [Persea americana]|uniref:Uncharacterized protein n=1 Tax=Persea americana TaxID=3435 RepID=A0ACC2LP31_PERAE|nr:hypothetical protein MRB53_009327 [Persea americana]
MFTLRIRLIVDHLRPKGSKADPRIRESRGIVHLYRPISRRPGPLPAGRTTLLFVLAVPSRMTAVDFIVFCASHVGHLTAIELIRNDAVDDHYSILIKLDNQKGADSFYRKFNGRRFSSSEAEICHILFIDSVEYTELSEIESAPPIGLVELPTCPVCLERLDQDTSGILTTLCDHSFQCPCISKWTDSSCPVCRFFSQQAGKPTCFVCETSENIWICIICGFVGCGRHQERHGIMHWKDTQHCYTLGLETKRVWDYVGERFVERLNQSKSDGKLVELNSHCRSVGEDDCGTCECSDDSGISGALFSGKVHAIVDEYNHLLATQLENQRQYYESLLAEAKAKREKSISEAVELAVSSKLQDIQNKLEKCIEDQKAVADINENLVKNQDLWRKKVKEIEERERTALRHKTHNLSRKTHAIAFQDRQRPRDIGINSDHIFTCNNAICLLAIEARMTPLLRNGARQSPASSP